MAEIQKLIVFKSPPGIRRDGTNLDGTEYSDGQWVRFQRGRPKKMGGYWRVTDRLRGPVRDTLVWSRGDLNNIFCFSGNSIEVVQVDENGGGSSITNRTPSGFSGSSDNLWSTDTMYDAAVGSTKTLVLALPSKSMTNIDDSTTSSLYYAPTDNSSAFVAVSDVNAVASGGVFVCSPYAVLYGTDGKVTWSNANEPQNYTTGDAGSARVSGAKFVQGKSIKSGSGASGLLWSLDALIKMDFIGGQGIFRFTKVASSSIFAQNSVVEYDGIFYWIGADRFLSSNGGEVKEIPNVMNLNWFFDNVNYAHRQKIWGMKVPRFGEVIWFYPRGDNTECSHAIVLNVREQCWYDFELPRSSGFYSQVFRYPVMVSSSANNKRALTRTVVTGEFLIDDIIIGSISGAIGSVVVDTGTDYYVELSNETEFVVGETLAKISIDTIPGTTDNATVTAVNNLYSLYAHEKGVNKVDDYEESIESYFTTPDFGLPANQEVNRWTRIVRIEPDFIQTGNMTVEVLGYETASSAKTEDGPFTFGESDTRVDMRVQRRHLQLKFKSNELNGFYEMGKVILHTEPGDIRV